MINRRLSFDHGEILAAGAERARSKLEYTSLATAFVGQTFTIAELRRVYEMIWGKQMDPGNFHRKIQQSEGLVERVGDQQRAARGRPAQIFRSGAGQLLRRPILR